MLRPLPVLALFVASALAGCLGSSEKADDLDEGTASVLPILDVAVVFDGDGASEGVLVPEGYGGFFVSYEITVEGRGTTATVTAKPPQGDAITVVSVATSALAASATREGWTILPPILGAWTFDQALTGDGSATGLANVTLLPAAAPLANVAGAGDDRVVVAVVDSGVNPYHDFFQRANLTSDRLPARIVEAESAAAPLSVPLARGQDYLDSVRLSAAVWSQVPAQTLVHFAGTNLLGYELDDVTLPGLPVLDRAGHGTMVAYAATRENPDVLIVLITGADYDAGVEWAAKQPWIDLISLSWGPPVNAAGLVMGPENPVIGFRTADATREAWRAGKVIFTASGNDPTPTFTDTTSGPPWAHAVAGSLPGGRATFSGNFVDTVADWTQELARYDSLDETTMASGTSFATPTTAGIASRILHDVRLGSGHVGGITDGALVSTESLTVRHADLRDALNMSAVWWDTAGFAQAADSPGDVLPVAPAAPWVSQGWGHLGPEAVTMATQGLLGIEPLPTKPLQAHAWMDAHMDLRERHWA